LCSVSKSELSCYKYFLVKHYQSSLSYVSKYLLFYYTSAFSVVSSDQKDSSLAGKPGVSKKNWLLLCNAQSLFYKIDDLRALSAAINPNFICITETWFTPDIENDLIQISGFRLFRNDRQDNPLETRRGGGTAIYASSKVKPSVIEIPQEYVRPIGVEYSLIAFHEPNISYLLCAYVPPGLSAELFLLFRQHVTDILDYVLKLSPNANVFVCGDFNRYDFSFLSNEFNMLNIVHVPTFRNATFDNFFVTRMTVTNLWLNLLPLWVMLFTFTMLLSFLSL
jgi:hypothetical protein